MLGVEIDVQLHLAVTVVGSKLSYPSVLGERQRLSGNLLSADSDWLTTNSTWVAFNLDVRVKRVMNIPHRGPLSTPDKINIDESTFPPTSFILPLIFTD